MRRAWMGLAIGITLAALLPFVGGPFAGEVVSDFKAKPLYRAVELSWKVERPSDGFKAFVLLRSDDLEGTYTPIATIPFDPQKTIYRYLDKEMGPGDLFYYKLKVEGVEETHGPVSAQAHFFPPAT